MSCILFDKEKQSESSPMSNRMIFNNDKQSNKKGICALPPETTNDLIIAVNLADLYINQSKLLPTPNTYTIKDSDVFCVNPNLQLDLILPCADETNPCKGLTHLLSTIITSLLDTIDVLYNYISILSVTGEAAFFNSRYDWLDSSKSLQKSILVQANHLKSQELPNINTVGCIESF